MVNLEGLRTTMLEMAAKDQNKAALIGMCKQDIEASRENYKKYGCDF